MITIDWYSPIFWMVVFFPAMALHIYCETRCTRLDVATGRRDGMALHDNYGSNRGWYWRWKVPSAIGALLAAPGVLCWGVSVLVLMSMR